MSFASFGNVYASDGCGPIPPSLPANVLEAALETWAQMGSQHAIPVTGQSMWPTIRNGDRVWIAHGSAHVQRADIVVYRAGGRLVVHRVVGLPADSGQRRFITRGDNSDHSDAPVQRSQVLGRVIAVERNGRTRRIPGGNRRWLGWGLAWAVARLTALRRRWQ